MDLVRPRTRRDEEWSATVESPRARCGAFRVDTSTSYTLAAAATTFIAAAIAYWQIDTLLPPDLTVPLSRWTPWSFQ